LPQWETEQVAAPSQQLEALVKDELRGPVRELVRRFVRELVREELNGTAAIPQENGAAPPTKECRVCGETKLATEFGKNRRVCKPCRREQGRSWEEGRVVRRREQRSRAAGATESDDEEDP
jgi:hypothetical protein